MPQKYSLKEEGGVLNNYGVVDFVNGIAPVVFVVVTQKLKDEYNQTILAMVKNIKE